MASLNLPTLPTHILTRKHSRLHWPIRGGGYRPHIFNGIHIWQIAQARIQVLIAGAKVFRMFIFSCVQHFLGVCVLCF